MTAGAGDHDAGAGDDRSVCRCGAVEPVVRASPTGRAMSTADPVALQRCVTFVGRTMNWMYDHLRMVPRFRPLVLCDNLENRDEFPELEAREIHDDGFLERAWRRLVDGRVYPPLRHRLSRLDPRVLHSHFGYVAESDLPLQRALDCPWVVAFYGADVYELGRTEEWRARYGPVFESAAMVLALGPTMADALEEMGCPREKIEVHPLGVDVESLPSAPRRKNLDEELRLLFAGTFREKKGIPYLLRGARIARDAGVRLRLELVGDASEKPGDAATKREVFRLIDDLELEAHVTHHSWLPFAELLELAMDCHVFVAPSVTAEDGDSEGTPFVIQQMMATAMPVIATQHSDIPFLFGEQADMLVPERDPDSIADRIRAYADEPNRLVSDGRALKRETERRLDVRDRAADLAELYATLDSASVAARTSGTAPGRPA